MRETIIHDQFLHPVMVASAMITIARKEVISDICRLSTVNAETQAWLVKTNKKGSGMRTPTRNRLRCMKRDRWISRTWDRKGAGARRIPEDHAALRSMREKMQKERPAYSTGRRWLALLRHDLDGCVR